MSIDRLELLQELEQLRLHQQQNNTKNTPRENIPEADHDSSTEAEPTKLIQGVSLKKSLDIDTIAREQGFKKWTPDDFREMDKSQDITESLDELLDQLR